MLMIHKSMFCSNVSRGFLSFFIIKKKNEHATWEWLLKVGRDPLSRLPQGPGWRRESGADKEMQEQCSPSPFSTFLRISCRKRCQGIFKLCLDLIPRKGLIATPFFQNEFCSMNICIYSLMSITGIRSNAETLKCCASSRQGPGNSDDYDVRITAGQG